MTPARLVFAIEAALLGGATASFLCVVAERLPRHETLGGRSHCVCGRQLRWYENIPVVGWVAARGKARCCGAKIPVHYVLTEAFLAIAWGAAVLAGWWGLVIAPVATGLSYLWARHSR